jgi:hypothetical protein
MGKETEAERVAENERKVRAQINILFDAVHRLPKPKQVHWLELIISRAEGSKKTVNGSC